MGILDKVSSLLPWRGERHESWRDERHEPSSSRSDAVALRDDMDRWLESLLADPWSRSAMGGFRWMPSVDVRETDKELIVTAEVPGLDVRDLELSVSRDGLTIRGAKREEKQDKRNDYYVAETHYGSFVRTVPLPPGLDVDQAEARVERGVLTVRFPKVDARPGSSRIPIGR